MGEIFVLLPDGDELALCIPRGFRDCLRVNRTSLMGREAAECVCGQAPRMKYILPFIQLTG